MYLADTKADLDRVVVDAVGGDGADDVGRVGRAQGVGYPAETDEDAGVLVGVLVRGVAFALRGVSVGGRTGGAGRLTGLEGVEDGDGVVELARWRDFGAATGFSQ